MKLVNQMKRHLVIALVAFASACRPSDAPSAVTRCNAACDRLVELGCSGLTPAGTSCEAFCGEVERLGHPMPTECVLDAQSCDEADACN